MSGTKTKRSSDSHQTKLRASCDGCYLTKIKCNKARPMCSRCLTYGIDCVYSPSSRSGRTKKDPNSNASKSDSEYGPSSNSQGQTYVENHPDSRAHFLHIPQVNLSDSESSYDFNPTILTPDLGMAFDQYPLFHGEGAVSGTGMFLSGSSTASFNSAFWWTETGIPITKHGSTFPDNNTLPLASDFPFSSPHILWDQYSDDLLDLTSYNTPDIHFSPSHSPTTSTSNTLPATCICFAGYSQDAHVLHNDSCPSFQGGL
jgi:hypothetical protein